MEDDMDDLVHVGRWCFCGHLRESCDVCGTDHRGSNQWGRIQPALKCWPATEREALLADQFDLSRRPILVASCLATKAGKDAHGEETYKCRKHSTINCQVGCFDFAQLLLRDAGLWDKHLSYLAKSATSPPPDTLSAPPALFERRFPLSRSYPPLPSGTALPSHRLTLTMPHIRLYSQLPPYGFHPLGWVFFAVVAAHPGPGMRYTLTDATGKGIPLQFVERWAIGPGEPSGPEAEPFRNLKVGTLLCFKCPTWSLGMRGGRELSVEKADLQGIKIMKGSMQDVATINATLLTEGLGCRTCGAQSFMGKLCCGVCKTRYCSPECQAKDWKLGGHKRACSTTAHLRALNLMFPTSA